MLSTVDFFISVRRLKLNASLFCQLLGTELKFKTLKFFTECFNFNKVFLEDVFSKDTA